VQTLSATPSGGSWSAVASAALTDGATYTVQAGQTNAAGTGVSAATTFSVALRTPTPTVTAPTDGALLTTGRPTVSGTATDPGPVSVRLYAGSAASGTPAQTLTATPAGGSWSVTPAALTDGTWTVQAAQSNAAGTGLSTAVSFAVDTAGPSAVSLTASNGTGTAGRIDVGDTLAFTYSEKVAPASLLAGWDGSSRSATFQVRDGNGQNPNDGLAAFQSGAAVNVGTVTLGSPNYVGGNGTPTVTATMSLSTVAGRSVLTFQVTSVATGNATLGTVASATTAWTPSTSVTDLAGNAATGGTVSQAARQLF
jgi:hypothetical protein